MPSTRFALIGGPTLLIEIAGLRLLTDPAFSPPGEYRSGSLTLKKLLGPALEPDAIGTLDGVLLSHDQHADNLDPAGRALLASVPATYTTRAGAQRLGGTAIGMEPWETQSVGGRVHVTAVPARHGPAGIEPISGDVIGFALGIDELGDTLYLTGDSVFFDGTAEVARRFAPRIVVVFAGAARTRGPFDLTMTTNDALDTAEAFPNARIFAVHTEGWAHFTQSFGDLESAFQTLGRAYRLERLEHGVPLDVDHS